MKNKQPLQNIKDTLKNALEIKFDQKYMDDLLKKMINESKTVRNKIHYQNSLNGGKCYFCEKDYVKKDINKGNYIKYSRYFPACNCYIKLKGQENKKEIDRLKCQFAGIPEKFIDKNFDNLDYIKISENTKKQINRVRLYIENKIYKKMGCLLYGDIGTGKTLLAMIIFKHLLLNENINGKYIRMSDILKEISKNNFEFVERIARYDVILLDDLDKMKAAKNINKSTWASERIFSMFDNLTNQNKIILSTTNVQNLNELNNFFDSAVVSRLIGSSEVIKMEGKDYRMIERDQKLKC